MSVAFIVGWIVLDILPVTLVEPLLLLITSSSIVSTGAIPPEKRFPLLLPATKERDLSELCDNTERLSLPASF